MTDVPLPLLTAPGLKPQAAGGRVLNCYPEKLPATAGKPYGWFRVPGLGVFGLAPNNQPFRGGVLVGSLFYGVFGSTVYSYNSNGGDGTALTGSAISGTDVVFAARNNAGTPDIVFVSPSSGAYWTTGASIASYPDPNVGAPNSVLFHKGFFIFTYGNGKTRASNVNLTSINTLSNATAESKPDTLYRPIPLGNGQLLLVGSNTMEVWGGDPTTDGSAYPFVYIATIPRGIIGPMAIAGHDDGFGKGIYFVGDDFRASRLDGYQVVPISNSDLDTTIERDPNKANIRVGVFNSRGHGFVAVQGTNWCWIFDTTLNTWHERASYLKNYWRGQFPVLAFGRWLCGDSDSNRLCEINANIRKEFGTNAVQNILITGSPAGGTYTLTYNGQTTANIAFNASAPTVQAALEALSRIGAGNVVCTGTSSNINVRFKDVLGVQPVPPITATSSLTGGSSPAITITQTVVGVRGDPIMMRIETGPFGPFPNPIRVNSIELFLTKGASDATGLDPNETDVKIAISISRNGGQDWSNPRNLKIGRQAITNGRVRSSIWGHAEVQGVRWRFEESAGVDFAFMGADQQQDVLR